MYLIRKRSIAHPDVWYPVAWTDLREYAVKISEALDMCEDGEFDFLEVVASKGGADNGKV